MNTNHNNDNTRVTVWQDEATSKIHLKNAEFDITFDVNLLPDLVDDLIDLQNK